MGAGLGFVAGGSAGDGFCGKASFLEGSKLSFALLEGGVDGELWGASFSAFPCAGVAEKSTPIAVTSSQPAIKEGREDLAGVFIVYRRGED